MRKLAAISILLLAATPAFAEAPPPVGVYECLDQNIQINPVLMFGLLDGKTYSNYDGKTGHYRYDFKSRQLIMIDGPFEGYHYTRTEHPDPATGADSFRMLDAQGQPTAFECPHNHVKDAHKHPW